MNLRFAIPVIALLGIVAFSALFWVPPLLETARSQPTSTPVLPTATPTPTAEHELRVVVRDANTGVSIAGTQVTAGGATGDTDTAGCFSATVPHGPVVAIEVRAPGYQDWRGSADTAQAAPGAIAVDVLLVPRVVHGQVAGQNLTPLPGATVLFGGQAISLDAEGRFALERASDGDVVTAEHPGYVAAEAVVDSYPSLYLVLQAVEVTVHARDAMTGVDIPGVSVCADERCQSTDQSGGTVLTEVTPGLSLTAQRQGYAASAVIYNGEPALTVEMAPLELHGRIRDAETGQAITRAIVLVGDQIVPLDGDGMYHLPDLSTVEGVFVKAPGYERVSLPLDASLKAAHHNALDPCQQGDVLPCADILLPRFAVHGIYVNFNLLWAKDWLLELIDFVDRSPVLNAIVLDIKGDYGYVAFESDDPIVRSGDAMSSPRLPISEFLRLCQERHIYTIARMVVFKDNALIKARPDLAVRHPNGAIFYDREGLAWGDPMREEVWEYNIAITKEAIRLGFDEVQYDYLRFPSDSTSLAVVRALVYAQPSTLETRTQAIAGFVKAAKAAVDPTHAFLSADIFGYALVIDPDHDMRIGQRLKDLAPHVDYVCPMIYPSTFESGNLGLSSPGDEPYTVIEISMAAGQARTDTPIRPWLQHYWYDRYEIAEQRRAAEAATRSGWCYWNAGAKYDELFFHPPDGLGP